MGVALGGASCKRAVRGNQVIRREHALAECVAENEQIRELGNLSLASAICRVEVEQASRAEVNNATDRLAILEREGDELDRPRTALVDGDVDRVLVGGCERGG